MKRLSILLGIAVGFVAPLAAHAELTALVADTTVPQAKPRVDRVTVTTTAPRKTRRLWYEVTNITAVGSHLPVVICHRDGLMYVVGGGAFTPSKAYRHEGSGLDTTGASNVAGQLISLDPAFTAGNILR